MAKVIILLICLYIIFVMPGGSSYSSGVKGTGFSRDIGGNNSYGKKKATRKTFFEEFEEAGSFYDKDGREHMIDDDNYCEDCDDYHDE